MARRPSVAVMLAVAVALAAAVLLVPGRDPTPTAHAAVCPSPPVTVAKLARLDVGEGLACYGDRVLVFRAFVPVVEGMGGTNAYVLAPRWFDDWLGSSVLLSAGPDDFSLVAAFVPPALGRCDDPPGRRCPFRPYRERWVTVKAQFDYPAARRCRYAGDPGGPEFTKQAAVKDCRGKLVVLAVGPAAGQPDTATVDVAGEAHGTGTDTRPAVLLAVTILAFVVVLLSPTTWRGAQRRFGQADPRR